MKNMTDINVVLDRSGSMSSCRLATIESFNCFLDEQMNGPDEAVVSLYRFDYEYESVYQGQSIELAPRLNTHIFVPRGSTALLDAIGRTIVSVGARLAALPESQRPSKVVIVIVTDGLENASKEYRRQQIFDMIRHQEEKYNWTFVYQGANQDAYAEAGNMGFAHYNSCNFAPTADGMKMSSGSLSRGMTKLRASSGGEACKLFFSPEDQAANDALAGKTPPDRGKVVKAVEQLINEVHKSSNISGQRIDIRKKDLVKSN